MGRTRLLLFCSICLVTLGKQNVINLSETLIKIVTKSWKYVHVLLNVLRLQKLQMCKRTGSHGDIFSVSSVQSLHRVQLFATPRTAARQASLSITNSQSLLELTSTELVMPSNHLILCCPFFLPPSIFPSNRVFSNESVLHIRWPKYWSFSFSISPSNEYSGLISFRKNWLDLFTVQGTLKSLLHLR